MDYLLAFVEGIITFISPCLLPMLPVYLSYIAGDHKEDSKGRTLRNVLGFILGFTIIFTLSGAFAGSLGALLGRYMRLIQIFSGILIIVFGLNFIGVIKIPALMREKGFQLGESTGFGSSVLFGIIFSVSWSPCVGTFLGTALLLAANQGSFLQGVLMLLVYSLGLGIPFLLSALLMDYLSNLFQFIKKHYNIIQIVSGVLLILVGISILTGTFQIIISKIGGLLS